MNEPRKLSSRATEHHAADLADPRQVKMVGHDLGPRDRTRRAHQSRLKQRKQRIFALIFGRDLTLGHASIASHLLAFLRPPRVFHKTAPVANTRPRVRETAPSTMDRAGRYRRRQRQTEAMAAAPTLLPTPFPATSPQQVASSEQTAYRSTNRAPNASPPRSPDHTTRNETAHPGDTPHLERGTGTRRD